MSLSGDVIAHLRACRVRCALIGAEALAVHGIARATLDSDLLVSQERVLRESFWSGFSPRAAITTRRGEADDPLGGLVRLRRRGAQADVIVGRPWTRRILDRTIRITVSGEELPVVDRAGLVVLKLFAGGPQDLLDVQLLLGKHGAEIRGEVEERLRGLPGDIARAWSKLR